MFYYTINNIQLAGKGYNSLILENVVFLFILCKSKENRVKVWSVLTSVSAKRRVQRMRRVWVQFFAIRQQAPKLIASALNLPIYDYQQWG